MAKLHYHVVFCCLTCVYIYTHTYIHTLHYITLHYIPYIHTYIRHITLHCITLHYIALHYIALHCITVHYITYIHTVISPLIDSNKNNQDSPIIRWCLKSPYWLQISLYDGDKPIPSNQTWQWKAKRFTVIIIDLLPWSSHKKTSIYRKVRIKSVVATALNSGNWHISI